LPVDPNEPKRGFWDKVLGRKGKVEQTPQPATPAPTPKPKRVKAKKEKAATTEPQPPEKPAEKPAPTEPKPEKTEPREAPESKAPPAPKATPSPKTPKGSKRSDNVKPAAAEEEANPQESEDAKFKAAKAKALEDPEIQELRQKSDAALDPEEGRKAMRAYNKGLYRKMRSIDPSIKERIDATESAIMRKLGE
jgi:hypothetical protein